ncbi:glycosyltransferase family 2 protein [Clostridium neonatale]|uniref:glycosyltransferase family 2 protein n=1 Tax=Clostridium neonatale TaxID=137838 RepID=UPI00291B5A23|nr:glycosyltransferase family 2 protein [Clostridium neonatale]CAI3193791.1 dolichol-phosphate hexosyltransferase [Clostridium neonatale]CAI3210838.1 dolichol-phosphate hexosyltransferase [Clostridium neonatale]
MDKIAVLIPCYNESKTIEKVIHDFKKALPEAVIYVYDNNSNDNTDKIAEEAGAIVRYEYKQGKGQVIRSMFADIEAECYLMIDGDDTYPAENAKEMVDVILDGKADMVIGDRLSSTYFNENKRPFHNVGNKLVRYLINFIFKNNIRDIMTGYRAFSYEFVKTFPVLSKGFEIETEMTIHALDKNMGLKNVIVSYRDRPEGSVSKLNTYSDGIKVIKTIINLFKNYKPFSFCATIGTIFLGIAVILFIPVFIEYLNTGLVERFPTLIVSGFLGLASLHSYFSGLTLNVIAHHQKQEFEFKLQQVKQFKKMEKIDNEIRISR